ncbi:hypothetical protein [Streptomyces sp. NPDC005303]|uniref:hypothetical protein n=1 Tax=Streptomyces sp. NPDC005303 TaxID=3155713 RepID=UPI0033AAEB70
MSRCTSGVDLRRSPPRYSEAAGAPGDPSAGVRRSGLLVVLTLFAADDSLLAPAAAGMAVFEETAGFVCGHP